MFYDATRLELLDWRQVALSDTPDRAGSRSWGNLIPRVAVIAHLRDRLTSTEFRCINTHLDHLSGRSRLRSLEYLRDEIAAEAGPAILTGDFNTGPGSPALDALLDGGALDDAWRSAGERGSAEYATGPTGVNRPSTPSCRISPGPYGASVLTTGTPQRIDDGRGGGDAHRHVAGDGRAVGMGRPVLVVHRLKLLAVRLID